MSEDNIHYYFCFDKSIFLSFFTHFLLTSTVYKTNGFKHDYLVKRKNTI